MSSENGINQQPPPSTPPSPTRPNNVLTFSQIDMKVPAATWKEIMAARMSDRVLVAWALFFLLVPLAYLIRTIQTTWIKETVSAHVRPDNSQVQKIPCEPFLERIENLEATVYDMRSKLEHMNTLLVEHIFEQKQTMVNKNVSESDDLRPHIEVLTPNRQSTMARKFEPTNSMKIANVGEIGENMNQVMTPFYIEENRRILM